jgi:hypothetical protein
MSNPTTRPMTRCVRDACNAPFHEHVDGACPNGSGSRFRKRLTRANAASQSFSADEVEVLARILKGLPLREDMRLITRLPVFLSVARKVQVMSERVKANVAERAAVPSPHAVPNGHPEAGGEAQP